MRQSALCSLFQKILGISLSMKELQQCMLSKGKVIYQVVFTSKDSIKKAFILYSFIKRFMQLFLKVWIKHKYLLNLLILHWCLNRAFFDKQ